MHQALTSSHIAAATAALVAVNSQVIFGTGDFRTQLCEETSFAFDCTPSHCFPIDQGNIGVNRFAEGASRVYSLSPLSDDDNTSAAGAGAPPPGGADSGSGGGSGKPVPKITAYDVFHALFSIPLRHEVRLGEAMAVYLIHGKRWIEEISKAKREVMRDTSNGLEDLERELEMAKHALSKKESAQHKLKVQVESLLHGVTSIFSRFVSSGPRKRAPLRKLREDIETLRKERGELEEGIARAKIAGEWLDRIGWSEYGFVFLTDAGLEALEKLKTFKDDERMGYMTADEYISKVVDGS
jgi:hypothetical protein